MMFEIYRGYRIRPTAAGGLCSIYLVDGSHQDGGHHVFYLIEIQEPVLGRRIALATQATKEAARAWVDLRLQEVGGPGPGGPGPGWDANGSPV